MSSQVAGAGNDLNFYYGEGYTEEAQAAIKREAIEHMNIENTNIKVYIPNIDSVPKEEFTMVRRNGFGGSDAGVLLGVNPYTTIQELIKQKASKTLSAEEKATSEQTAVKMGNDLEPLVIAKWQKYFNQHCFKPADMYEFKDYPYLKMNFDGVTTQESGQHVPVEIKIVTAHGERHYNPSKEIFNERDGFRPLQPDISEHNASIQVKAAHYGIPPYYYCQVQMQMFAVNASYGYLATLHAKDWSFHCYYMWKDQAVWNDLIIQGYKAWQKVEALKGVDQFGTGLDRI